MALTKAGVALDACQEIAQNALTEGGTGDVSGAYEATLLLQLALTTETAHTGTKVVVQVSGETSGDEDWVKFTEFVALVGTAAKENITNAPAAIGTTVFTVASTTGFITTGLRFIEDVTIFANSEWLYEKTYTTDTSVTMLDGSTRAHAVSSILYTGAESRTILIPASAQRVRVLYDNTYDADGSTVAVRSRLAEVTAI